MTDDALSGETPAVNARNLRVVRGKTVVLPDFSVQIARGTITGLLGPSGCGKTTLMRSIVGTQVVTSGTVVVLGHPAGSPQLRRRVGYLTQEPTIYKDLRVIDNVRYFAALYGVPADAADAAIDGVGLADQATAYCGNLSGGQRTRASLACALVCRPDLLVLDEPTVGLDPVLRVELWRQFHELARRGTTLLGIVMEGMAVSFALILGRLQKAGLTIAGSVPRDRQLSLQNAMGYVIFPLITLIGWFYPHVMLALYAIVVGYYFGPAPRSLYVLEGPVEPAR